MQATDEELVARALARGDQAAFGELVRRHQSRVRSWLRQLTRDAAAADDVAQEAFITAWEKLASYGGRGKFSSWLLKIAWNEFLMSHRRRKGSERLATAVEAATTDDQFHDPAGELAVAADLERLLAVLGTEERAALILCYAQGLSHAEASEITGMPLGTIKSHINRGKDKIRQRFFPQGVPT